MKDFEDSDIPLGWEKATLGEVVRIRNGYAFKSIEFRKEGVPLVRQSNLSGSTVDLSAAVFLPSSYLDAFSRFLLSKGDILIGMSGSIGKLCLYDRESPALQNQRTGKVDFLDANPDLRSFVWQFLHTVKELLHAKGKGLGVQNVSASDIEGLSFLVPPLNEQRRIVTKIEALQQRTRRARTALDAIPPLLEKFRQSVLASAFRGDLTADWRAQNPDVEPASVLLERIREERRRRWEEAELEKMRAKGKVPSDDRWKNRYREPSQPDLTKLLPLPHGWAWLTVDAVSTKVSDGVHKKPDYIESGIPFITVRNLTRGASISFDDTKYISREDHEEFIKRTHPEAGDILISKDGTLGTVRVVKTRLPFSIFVSVALVKPVFCEMSDFLGFALSSPLLQNQMVGVGSGLQHIHLKDLRQDCVPIPPLREQREIVSRLESYLNSYEVVGDRVDDIGRQIDQMDNSILAKAFRGELVPQDPNDEPAAKLLERIQSIQPQKPTRGRKSPKSPPPKKTTPTPESTIPLDAQTLHTRLHQILLGQGPMDRDTAIRHVAAALRHEDLIQYKRLRSDGPLYQTLSTALDQSLEANNFDQPLPGEIRAILPEGRTYTPTHWRQILLTCLGNDPIDRQDAIKACATWAAETMGLQFQRLRQDGVIVKGLKSAISTALRRGELEKIGSRQIRRTAPDQL